jgi:hypothetical protein
LIVAVVLLWKQAQPCVVCCAAAGVAHAIPIADASAGTPHPSFIVVPPSLDPNLMRWVLANQL